MPAGARDRGGRNGRPAPEGGNSTEKTLDLLHELAAAEQPRRLADIAESAGLLKPTAHRILSTLVSTGHAALAHVGSYQAGPRLRALGAELTGGDADITDVLAELSNQAGHTVHLAVRSGDHAVYTHKIETDRPYRLASRLGTRLPLHSTAIGWCILAHLPAGELDAALTSTPLPARTPNTVTDPALLRCALGGVRERGWAIDDQENEACVRCLGAPLLDRDGVAFGAISASALAPITSLAELEALAPRVTRAARRIEPLSGAGG